LISSSKLNKPSSSQLDSVITAKMNQYHFPGLQACIVKDDSIIWKGAFGYANFSQNKLVTDSTLFYSASISKPFTGTAIMQLWEEGLFSLDDDINGYLLPPFQVRNPRHPGTPITFRMLLTHISSINDNPVANDSLWAPGDNPIALDSFLVNYLMPGGLYYHSNNFNSWAPGIYWDYSNVAVGLIGYLVELLSNNSFEQYCQDSIFIPLGMNEATWFYANLDTNNIAMPYIYNDGIYIPSGFYSGTTYPAGGLKTSAIQTSRFLRAFIKMGKLGGIRILDSSTVNLMTTVQYSSINLEQGLIWFINTHGVPNVGPRIICAHQGSSSGGVSTLFGYVLGTGENVGAVVFANRNSDAGIYDIGLELMSYGLLYPVGISENNSKIVKEYSLNQNYPNPFNPSTKIKFELHKAEKVKIEVFNLLGQTISTLLNKQMPSGSHEIEFTAHDLPSSVYLYRIEAGQYQEVKKMILLK